MQSGPQGGRSPPTKDRRKGSGPHAAIPQGEAPPSIWIGKRPPCTRFPKDPHGGGLGRRPIIYQTHRPRGRPPP
eukprot:4013122-Pyramimonas_sp.AAC.1